MTIAVLGATGHLGALVIDALIARGVAPDDIRAIGRSERRLATLAERGLQTARSEYGDPASLQRALDGVANALLISGSEVGRRVAQHANVIDAAKLAGVDRLVYTSAPHADDTPLVLAPEHRATEEALRASGLAYTILRDGWYTENYRGDFDQAREHGVIRNSVGEGRIASAPRRDYAEAAAVVLTGTGHENRVYEVTGDHAWSFREFAETAARVLGHPVVYETITPEQELTDLEQSGVDHGTAEFVVVLNGNTRDGLLGETNGVLSGLIGHPTEPLEQTMRGWVER
ncbi:SDR family oxidoreductase [Pseudoclavibacter caeni]|uniref:SDR family oxidoreductase n=1 Tax=Pseudoclavibacter caeni TaxID=908846 RepID=A0A7C8BRD0_9MICO|nr:SDR family oxidoreductase [Pseudoclavibacter caeni]KAB1631748.1 SDR family oxidoreductase [Pseudoclavibacter caeni]NYJ97384.1 NAD(P)H dehydrogenase (quinone) [Pseudoclavibacter caeni]